MTDDAERFAVRIARDEPRSHEPTDDHAHPHHSPPDQPVPDMRDDLSSSSGDPAKEVWCNSHRGFESHPLRHVGAGHSTEPEAGPALTGPALSWPPSARLSLAPATRSTMSSSLGMSKGFVR
jgi:hypothetical protein